MVSLFTFDTEPGPCGYLPDREWLLRYEVVSELTREEYQALLLAGWRRFGHSLFRPTCPACSMCLSLRVPLATFKPDRSQRRAEAANGSRLQLIIDEPQVSRTKLNLYNRYHRFQQSNKGWSEAGSSTASEYIDSFVDNPFPSEEWRYYRGSELVGVGYVDAVAAGLSAIYFYYDPAERGNSIGTFNVLSILREATRRGLPHVYLGYYVRGCRSLEYKARFRPNEVLDGAGKWRRHSDV